MGIEGRRSELLQIPKDRLDNAANLADFGFDSIRLAEFASLLTTRFGVEITPALFFGQSTLEKLTQYLVARHPDVLQELYHDGSGASHVVDATLATYPQHRSASTGDARNLAEPIAVIGMSGRFPQSRDIDEMWEILAAGRHAVEEIPADRFDWRKIYGDPAREPGKTNCKWCGCIPGVSEFDTLFFEISPHDAENMDPRQRHLLQEAWKALEDAAYGEGHIAAQKIGMFVGVEEGDFDEVWRETVQYFEGKGERDEISRAERNPKHKMALVFRWYFGYSMRLAFEGDLANRVDFQVHTGPALGAFNQSVAGTRLEDWRNRHVDAIGITLMEQTAAFLSRRFHELVASNR